MFNPDYFALSAGPSDVEIVHAGEYFFSLYTKGARSLDVVCHNQRSGARGERFALGHERGASRAREKGERMCS